MARKKNSKLAAVLMGPALVIGGVMALWQNEGRFDYYAAARDATVLASPADAPPLEAVAYTGSLRTDIPIAGDYVTEFVGYHLVRRSAEIYSWERSEDSDGNTTWDLGWQSSLESNSRNSGLTQRLRSATLYPDRYELGPMEIDPRDIHFVDDAVSLAAGGLTLRRDGLAAQLQAAGDYFFLDGGNPDDLGDERVSYTAIPNAPTASYFGVIAGGRAVGRQFQQNDGIIASLIGNDGILHHLVNGERETALAKVRADLKAKTWFVRIGGTVAIVMGFFVFFSVFVSLLYRVPLLGRFVESGVFLLSLALGLPLALFVILAGLVFHNPVTIALPLALLVGGAIWFQRRSKAAGSNARAALEQRVTAAAPPPAPPASAPTAGSSAGPPPPPPTDAASHSALIENSFTNLAVLALAEGELAKREQRFLTTWGKENGISPGRMKELFAIARRDPPEAHHATREDLELLALMALSDGVLSKPELSYLSRVAKRLGVPEAGLRAMLRDIEKGELAPA